MGEEDRGEAQPNRGFIDASHTAPAAATLLPCPWCGLGQSQVDLFYCDFAMGWRVGCGRCGVQTGIVPKRQERTKEAAIAAWNTRSAPTTADVARELREALEEARRFLDYFANGRTLFAGAGTPLGALAQVDAALARATAAGIK